MARRVQFNMNYDDAVHLQEIVTETANEFYETHDMNDRMHLEQWADLDRIRTDIALTLAFAETQ